MVTGCQRSLVAVIDLAVHQPRGMKLDSHSKWLGHRVEAVRDGRLVVTVVVVDSCPSVAAVLPVPRTVVVV